MDRLLLRFFQNLESPRNPKATYTIVMTFGLIERKQLAIFSSVSIAEVAAMTGKERARLCGGEHTVVLVLFVQLPRLEVLLTAEAQVQDVQRDVMREQVAGVDEHVVEVLLAIGHLARERLKFVVGCIRSVLRFVVVVIRSVRHLVRLGGGGCGWSKEVVDTRKEWISRVDLRSRSRKWISGVDLAG